MRQEEHQPLKMLVCSRINESLNEEDEDTETSSRQVLKSVVGQDKTKAGQNLKRIFERDEQEEEVQSFSGGSLYNKIYQQRVRGIASSSMEMSFDDYNEVDLES